MNQELFNIIVRLIIAVVSVIITSVIIPWIKENTDSTKYNDFLMMVEMCVEAANQIYTPEQWAEKKQYVLEITSEYAVEHGVTITPAEINAIIEGFVIAIKKG